MVTFEDVWEIMGIRILQISDLLCDDNKVLINKVVKSYINLNLKLVREY